MGTKKNTAAPAPEKPDPLADRIIENGFAPNRYILDLNGSLTVPHTMALPAPWNLPSRMFRFPIVVSRQAEDGSRRITLRHPSLVDHPFVRDVVAAIGAELDVTDAHGWDGIKSGQWWHAVDLMTGGHWRDLLATRQFTTDDKIAEAVGHGLWSSAHDSKKQTGYISTADAREIMRQIDSKEPVDRNAILSGFMKPSQCTQDGGKITWPINNGFNQDAYAKAWGSILGIEAGWFAHDRGGFLNWTQSGRDRFAAGGRATFVEASGQAAFAF